MEEIKNQIMQCLRKRQHKYHTKNKQKRAFYKFQKDFSCIQLYNFLSLTTIINIASRM